MILKPAIWAERFKLRVLDPDGWRKGSQLGEKGWEVPIDKAEFMQRLSESTIYTR